MKTAVNILTLTMLSLMIVYYAIVFKEYFTNEKGCNCKDKDKGDKDEIGSPKPAVVKETIGDEAREFN
jgi:hypothetical protein